jgi:hypothetical protein
MENPAERARLTPRELKLLDLDDDALIMIIKKLDHKSKKQMMLTCKKFEGLIGSTHQFYKNFKFRFDQKKFLKTKETRFLAMVRRRFGIVEISGGTDNNCSFRHKSLKTPILEFLKNIGADILKISFDELFFFEYDFWKPVFGTEPEPNPEPGFYCRTEPEPEPKNARTRTEPEPVSENRNRTQRTRVLLGSK